MVLKRTGLCGFGGGGSDLSHLSSDTSSQQEVFGHDGDSLCVDGAQVGVLEQLHQVCFYCFLQGQER